MDEKDNVPDEDDQTIGEEAGWYKYNNRGYPKLGRNPELFRKDSRAEADRQFPDVDDSGRFGFMYGAEWGYQQAIKDMNSTVQTEAHIFPSTIDDARKLRCERCGLAWRAREIMKCGEALVYLEKYGVEIDASVQSPE